MFRQKIVRPKSPLSFQNHVYKPQILLDNKRAYKKNKIRNLKYDGTDNYFSEIKNKMDTLFSTSSVR